ncbi:MAG: hypothetical protein ACYC0M_10205 [Burkholderiales bacterium]
MQVIDLLEKVKQKTGATTDYKLSKLLEISDARISDYRNGKRIPDAYACTRIALALEMEPMEIIAEIEAETEKNEQKRTFWRNFKLRSGKATVIILALSFMPFWSTGLNTGINESYNGTSIMRSGGGFGDTLPQALAQLFQQAVLSIHREMGQWRQIDKNIKLASLAYHQFQCMKNVIGNYPKA